MSECSTEQMRELLDSLYREDSGRILATLIRLLGNFDLAEEAMHEAFAAALGVWPRALAPGRREGCGPACTWIRRRGSRCTA
jgi:RNA polymerase sigma-70 factor (ECF subfamily)